MNPTDEKKLRGAKLEHLFFVTCAKLALRDDEHYRKFAEIIASDSVAILKLGKHIATECDDVHYLQAHRMILCRLRSGEYRASGIRSPVYARTVHRVREIIWPTWWDRLVVDMRQSILGLTSETQFTEVEIFDGLSPTPKDFIDPPPTPPAASTPPPEFEHNEDYTSVRIREHRFALGQQLGQVIARYHEASLAGDPGRSAKIVLSDLGYQSDCLASVFKGHTNPSWRELLAPASKRGHWRLNLHGEQDKS